MRKLYLIGIGAGNPEYVTVQAIKALNAIDVFFFMNKGESKEELVRLRKEICERYIEHPTYKIVEAADPVRDPAIADYTARVEHWHHERVLLCEQMIQRELSEDQCGAFLIWGDPSLYDSTLRIIEQITARGILAFDYEVIPGITSIQALAARHRIMLNGIGESVLITTGRHLAEGSPSPPENTVVMLDGQSAYKGLTDDQQEIFWGAYLGMENEILISGKLSEAAEKIDAVRKQAREQHGWIMDVYLLRKPSTP